MYLIRASNALWCIFHHPSCHSLHALSPRLYNILLFPGGGWLEDGDDDLLDEAPQDLPQQEEDEDEEEGAMDTAGGESKESSASPTQPEPNRAQQLAVLRSIYIPQVGFGRGRCGEMNE